MTEAEYLSSDDPGWLLAHLTTSRGPIAERKLRLWVEACRTEFDHRRPSGMHWPADLHTPQGLAVALVTWQPGGGALEEITLPLAAALLREIVGNPFRPVVLPPGPCSHCGQPLPAHGQHIHVPGPCSWLTWNDGLVPRLAQAAYDERVRKCNACHGTGNGYHVRERHLYLPPEEFCPPCRGTGVIDDGTLDPERLLVLADALEEADCSDAKILGHLREPGPHVRGCWCVDLILGEDD